MKYLCFVLFFAGIFFTTNGQNNNNFNNNKTMKKLNLNLDDFKYEGEYSDDVAIKRITEDRRKLDSIARAAGGKHADGGQHGFGRRMMIKGDTVRKLNEGKDYYLITERINNSAFSTVKKYSKISLTLTIEGLRFYDLSIGLWKYYDDDGNLIETKDYDKFVTGKDPGNTFWFSFSIEKLIDKFKKEYYIDLSFPKDEFMNVRRSAESIGKNNIPTYEITIPKDNNPLSISNRLIKVDGKTGKVISDQIVPIEFE